jgi:MoaA/NifB/PqqE/SkfB family radical SAM enzyme
MKRTGLYWDDFNKRIEETSLCVKNNLDVPVRRVAVFITNRCNFKCHYCNVSQNEHELSMEKFDEIVDRYGQSSIIHITGGEPSIVPWLYDYIESKNGVRFHLNTNAYIRPPLNIKRLKISLDSTEKDYFDKIVHMKGAFDLVVKNIKEASKRVVTSITCTLTRENYRESPQFMKWCRREFPNLYAVFFSVYKGRSKRFTFTDQDADNFFNVVKPSLEKYMDSESLGLLQETIDEKTRVMQNVRFPENLKNEPCYISMSEKVFDCNGGEWHCSHLFRDGIMQAKNEKHKKCLYGCNRKLVEFNKEVSNIVNECD